MENKALVVIDIQNDITKNYREIIDNINQAIEWAKQKDFHIIYIRNAGKGSFVPGSRGFEFVPELNMVSENIFTKEKASALTCENFVDYINKNSIDEFYIAGADAVACIKSTCYNMTKAGYTVHMLSDCVTSYAKGKIPEMLEYYMGKGCFIEKIEELMK